MTAPSIADAWDIGATGATVEDGERLAFEAWVSGHCWLLGTEWDGRGCRSEYEVNGHICHQAMITRMMWAAWRDRAALAHNV